MSVTSIKRDQVRADRSDAPRAALAQAIEAERKAKAAVSSQRAAIERASVLVASAETAVEAAKTGVAVAREQHAAAIAKAAAAGTAPGTGKVRESRRAEADAEDDLAASHDALERLQSELAPLEEAAALAANAVIAAVNAAAVPAAEAALVSVRVARARYFAAAAVLTVLIDSDDDVPELSFMAGIGAREARLAPMATVKDQATSLMLDGPVLREAEAAAAHAVQQAWRQWRRDLRTDPQAPPPDFGAELRLP